MMMMNLLLRPGIDVLPRLTRRYFHAIPPLQLIYNTEKKSSTAKKNPTVTAANNNKNATQSPPASTSNPTTGTSNTLKKNSKLSFQDQVKLAQSNLLTNKYYKATPNFLKPYIAGFLTRPIGFGISFFILHEITALVPLISLWYLFIKFNWVPLSLPTEFIAKGVSILTEKLTTIPDSKLIYDKATIIMAGANAYAATKILMPFRLPLSILLTPWFDRVVVQRVRKLFTKKK